MIDGQDNHERFWIKRNDVNPQSDNIVFFILNKSVFGALFFDKKNSLFYVYISLYLNSIILQQNIHT